MKLYDYYRSTASYRVRIALNLKNMSYQTHSIHLIDQGGEQNQQEYKEINPQGLVPTLDENGHIIHQSLAIIEYLDELYPTPSLLPQTPLGRAKVRGLALLIACDIHPLNNLRVLKQLKAQFKATEDDVSTWYHLWLKEGFDAFEAHLQKRHHPGNTCYGNDVSLADVCLIPQVFNAKRFKFNMDNYPLINEIYDYCANLPAFVKAAPLE